VPSNFVEVVFGDPELIGAGVAPSIDGAGVVRSFCRVLYDYDPATGPNEGGDTDELAIAEDEVLEVVGEVDDEGFFVGRKLVGELAGTEGAVPGNFVEHMTADESADFAATLAGDAQGGVEATKDGGQVALAKALFEYVPEVDDGETPEDLEFSEGTILRVYGEPDADGFYDGEHTDPAILGSIALSRGFVPSNFVQLLTPDEVAAQQALGITAIKP
jgi:hypothetical protein